MKKVTKGVFGYGRPFAPGLTFAALKLACAEYRFEELL
jgi:hypothetical protein